jgi:hypothetical protein
MVSQQQVAPDVVMETRTKAEGGLSIRDYFAALAMQGYLAEGRLRKETLKGNKEVEGPGLSVSYYDVVALCSYQMADAMLRERSRS